MSLIRAVALNVIKSLVPLNLPGSKVLSTLQGLNLTYRRTDMLADIRTAFDRVKYETQITSLKGNQVIPSGWMNTEELGAPYNYRVHLKVDYYDPETGDRFIEHRYMFSDDYKKIGDWQGDFPGYVSELGYVQEYQTMGVQVVGATKNVKMAAEYGTPF